MELANEKFDQERYGKVTGSKVAVLFPKKSAEVGQDTYARQLASQLYFKYYDETSTWQTEHGNYSEYSALEHYQNYYCKEAEKGKWISKGEMGGTCDCLAPTHGVDFKCPTSLEKWLDYLHDGIDSQQYHQAQMYMYLFNKPLWKVCIYLTETLRMSDFGITYPVEEKNRMIIIEVQKEIGWAEKLEVEVPKLIVKRDKYFEELKKRFG
jgi:hypothetical protein